MKNGETVRKVEYVTLIVSIIYILVGIFQIWFQEQLSQVFGYVLAALAIGVGIYRLVLYFIRNRTAPLLVLDLYTGILWFAFGILCFIRHEEMSAYLQNAFAIFLIAGGIIKMQNAVDLARLEIYRWWIILLLGFLSVAFSILLIVQPKFMESFQLLATGIFLLYDGISGLVTAILIEYGRRRAGIDFEKQSETSESGRVSGLFKKIRDRLDRDPELDDWSVPTGSNAETSEENDEEYPEDSEEFSEDDLNFDPETGETLR